MINPQNTAVVASSSSGLDYYYLKHDVFLLQNQIILPGKTTSESEINAYKYNQWLSAHQKKQPTIEAASHNDIARLISLLAAKNIENIIMILPSAHLSSVQKHVSEYLQDVAETMNIVCFDTKTFGLGEAILALTASELVKQGIGLSRISAHLQKARQQQLTLFGLPNLNAMLRHGTFTCNACENNRKSLKPLFYIDDDGKIDVIDCFHHETDLLNAMYDEIKEFSAFCLPTVNVIHSANAQLVKSLHDKMLTLDIESVHHYPASVSLATYTGHGYIGVVVEKLGKRGQV